MRTPRRGGSRAIALAVALYVASLAAPTTYSVRGEWPLDTGAALVRLAAELVTSHGILAGLFPVLANVLLVIGLLRGAHRRSSATGFIVAGFACAVVSILVMMFYVALLAADPARLLVSPAMWLWLASYLVGLHAVRPAAPAADADLALPTAIVLRDAA